VKEKGEISVDDLMKFCETELGLKRGATLGAVNKLIGRGFVKTE
jgi:hypothetical protein